MGLAVDDLADSLVADAELAGFGDAGAGVGEDELHLFGGEDAALGGVEELLAGVEVSEDFPGVAAGFAAEPVGAYLAVRPVVVRGDCAEGVGAVSAHVVWVGR